MGSWLVRARPRVARPFSFAIPKASAPAHVEENAGAADVELTEMQIARIDKAFPLGPPPRQLPML